MALSSSSSSSSSLVFFLSTRSFQAFTDYKRWHNSLSHVALNETQTIRPEPQERKRENMTVCDHHRPSLSPTQPIGSPSFFFHFSSLFRVVVNVFASSPSKSSKAFFFSYSSFLTTPGPVDLSDMDSFSCSILDLGPCFSSSSPSLSPTHSNKPQNNHGL